MSSAAGRALLPGERDLDEQHGVEEPLINDGDDGNNSYRHADGHDADDDDQSTSSRSTRSSSEASTGPRRHRRGDDDDDDDGNDNDGQRAPSSLTGNNSQQVFLQDITEVASRLDLPVTSIIRPLMARQQEEAEHAAFAAAAASSSSAQAGGGGSGYDATQVLNSGPLHAPVMRSPGDRALAADGAGGLPRRLMKISLSSQDVEKLLKDDEDAAPTGPGVGGGGGAFAGPPKSSDRMSSTSPVPPGSSAVTVAYNSSTDRFDNMNIGSTRSIPGGANNTAAASGGGTVSSSTASKKSSHPTSPLKGHRHGSSVQAPPAAASPSQPLSNKRVGFASSEVQNVHVYEVDNSLFISIQYARPIFGWIVLLLAILFGCTSDVVNVYHMGKNDSAAYVYATWSSFGLFLLVVGLMFPTWLIFVRPTKAEAAFLYSRNGVSLVAVCGLVGAMAKLSQQATAHIVQEWRWLALSAVHPFLIVLFGKIFRNYVFLEEAVGSAVMLVGFVVALMAADTRLDRWPFAEIVSLSQGIYIASFLFLAVKLRAKRVSIVVTASSVALIYMLCQIAVCLITGQNFAVEAGDHLGVFHFFQEDAFGPWLLESVSSSVSLICYLLTLKFIPPLTVSAAMCIQVMFTQFASYMILFNPSTAVWPLCPSSTSSSGPSPMIRPPFSSPSPPVSRTQEVMAYCNNLGDLGSSDNNNNETRNTLFAIGSVICVFAAGYLVYVSSIKRSKVDMLLRHLSHRKTPRNPYEKKREDEEKFLRAKSPLLPASSGAGGSGGGKRERRRGSGSNNRASRGSLHADSTSLHTISGSSGDDERNGGIRRVGTSPSNQSSVSSDGTSPTAGGGGGSDGGTTSTRRRESPQASKRNSGIGKVVVHKTTGNARVVRASPPQQQSAVAATATSGARNQLDSYYDEV